MSDSDDDLPQLSAETFAALQEFYNEEENKMKNKLPTTCDLNNKELKFEENWVYIFIIIKNYNLVIIIISKRSN